MTDIPRKEDGTPDFEIIAQSVSRAGLDLMAVHEARVRNLYHAGLEDAAEEADKRGAHIAADAIRRKISPSRTGDDDG